MDLLTISESGCVMSTGRSRRELWGFHTTSQGTSSHPHTPRSETSAVSQGEKRKSNKHQCKFYIIMARAADLVL